VANVDIPSIASSNPVGFWGWPETVTSKGGSEPGALARAFGTVLEGLTFYDLANAVTAEVRVKVAFEEFGRVKRAQLAKLEAVAPPGTKDAAKWPGIFPLDAVSKVDCYVCGYTVDAKALPNQCPKCGAARYAFEKEIALSKVWEIAVDAGRKSAALFREAAAQTQRRARAVLEELAREEEEHASDADRQLAELRT